MEVSHIPPPPTVRCKGWSSSTTTRTAPDDSVPVLQNPEELCKHIHDTEIPEIYQNFGSHQTTNLIYVITRRSCDQQCIGETNLPFKVTIEEPTPDIIHERGMPVTIHFNSDNHWSSCPLMELNEVMTSYPFLSRNTRIRRDTELY